MIQTDRVGAWTGSQGVADYLGQDFEKGWATYNACLGLLVAAAHLFRTERARPGILLPALFERAKVRVHVGLALMNKRHTQSQQSEDTTP